jgi:hypothetical protein
MFLQKVGTFLPEYTASHTRRLIFTMIHAFLRIYHVQYLMGVQVSQQANISGTNFFSVTSLLGDQRDVTFENLNNSSHNKENTAQACLSSRDRLVRTAEEHNRCVGAEVLTALIMNCSILCDITPCSPLKINRCFGGTWPLHLQGRIHPARKQHATCSALVSCLTCSSTPKMEATYSSETLVDFQRTTRRHTPEE